LLDLGSRRGYLQRRRFIRQVAVSGVSGGDIAQFPVACPPLAEQDRAIARDNATLALVLREEEALAKLRTVRQGLMDDLLMGRVRVTVPEAATP
jgi:hypothetical protein